MRFDAKPIGRRPRSWWLKASATALSTFMAWSPALAYAQDTEEEVYVETDVDVSDTIDPSEIGVDATDEGPPLDGAAATPTTEPDPSATPIALPSTEEGGSGVTPQAISLPDAEGSVEGMGESFSPVLSSGTATFSVPIAVAPGRAGVQPSLALSYATTGGNGPVGFGWNLGAPFISRQTDRGMPQYIDEAAWHQEEDRFIYNGGQELVPVDSAAIAIVDDDARYSGDNANGIPDEFDDWQQYRARVEGSFMRFFRSRDSERWIVQSTDGTRFEFGRLTDGAPTAITASSNAVERDPEVTGTTGGIFRWCLTRMSDAHGSTVYYVYDQDDGRSYLSDVYYVSPNSCGGSGADDARTCNEPLSGYAARVHLEYEPRQDVFAGYVSGWRIATARRLKRVDVSAYNDTLAQRTRVRRYHLTYDPASFHSLLTSVQVEGRPQTCTSGICEGDTTVLEGSNDAGERLPAMTFEYSEMPSGSGASDVVPGFGGISQQVNPVSNSPPHSVDESRSDLFDVNSDGLPDLVVTDPARYRTEDGRPAVGVFFNGFTGRRATPAGAAATFSDAVPMAIPYGLDTVMSLGNANVVPMDIDGDGRGDLLHMPRFREYGWWSATRRGVDAISPADQGWEWTYAQVALPPDDTDPRIDLGRDARHIRVLDVNNDHLIDIVRTTGTVMQTWVNLGWLPGGEGRFGSYRYTDAGAELSTEPYESCLLQGGLPIDFEDPEVRLGDMNGDGLQDIVQMRRGRVVYWPGRGEGVWGTGSRRCDRGEGAGRQIEMANPPPEVNPELDGVYLSDVNMDGADDMVQVRFREVDVWFNEAGQGWTRRTIARSTPTAPAFAPRVRFTDIDGSATTDIVWANAGRWEYIDPTGGQRPRLLVAVHNGLGADTDITYGSSAQDYLRDLEEAASTSGFETFDWNATPTGPDARLCELSDQAFTVGCTSSTPDEWLIRSTGSPVVSTVVRAVSTTDNFDRLGRAAQVSESQFAYHDGYYEGIEQEFRGFGAADAVTVGDWNNPTVYSRTHFLQGRRPSEIEGDRLAENPNEALKGREVLTEVFDDSGDFLSTSFATMANRHLATGLDGRAIHYAFVRETNELRYDTTPFVAGSATLELDAVQREAVNPATGAVGSPVTERTRTVAVRADVAHTSRIRTEFYEVLNIGVVRSRREHGRVGVLSNDVIDYRRAHQNLMELINDAGQWIWRSKTAHVEAVGWHPLGGPRLGRLTHHYFDNGDVDRSIVDMGGSNGSPEDHAFGADPANEGGAASYTQTEQNQNLSYAYDAWGQPIAACHGSSKLSGNDTFKAGCLRFSRTDYDDAFHQVVETEQIFWHRNSHESLDSSGEWDRGLGAITVATDPNGLDSTVTYDGLGRLTSVTPPNVAGCSGAQVTTHIEYELTTNPRAQPISRVTSTTELDCAGGTGEQLQSIAYVDGLGRARATLATSENGGEWIRSGITTLDKKGTVRRTYQTDRFEGVATDFGAVVALPSTPYAVVRYDAFGRTRGVIAEDGAVTWTSYHSLSTDVCDPLDNDPSSPFFHTCTTTVVDGFGRTIDQILRNVDPDDGGSEETYHLWTYYRVDDAVSGLVRANGGTRPDWYDGTLPTDAVLRTFVYDRHGRRLASDDPDTDDPNNGDETSNSWRYLYNQVNDLIAVRDPRGCGQNFFYDHAGRLRGEQYVSCTEAQSARAEQPAHSASGLVADGWSSGSVDLDVEYHYDDTPSWASGIAPSGPTEGRATGVSDRGQRAAIAYDDRGNPVWTARQMALISDELGLNSIVVSSTSTDLYYDRPEQTEQAATSATVTYDTDHTYVRTATFDNAGRPTGIELPQDPDFSGTAPHIEGLLTYNDRGLPSRATLEIDSVEQPIVESIEYLRDGLVSRIVYGDDDDGSGSSRTPTESETFYDVRRRPIRMRTTRASTGTGTLDEVTAVADQELVWDGANNLTAVVDHRDPDEWDAGHLPQTVTIGHDALYRVTRAEYLYTQSDGSRTTSDLGTNWRTNFTTAQSEDPMRTEPAGIAPGALLSAGQRVHTMSWGWRIRPRRTTKQGHETKYEPTNRATKRSTSPQRSTNETGPTKRSTSPRTGPRATKRSTSPRTGPRAVWSRLLRRRRAPSATDASDPDAAPSTRFLPSRNRRPHSPISNAPMRGPGHHRAARGHEGRLCRPTSPAHRHRACDGGCATLRAAPDAAGRRYALAIEAGPPRRSAHGSRRPHRHRRPAPRPARRSPAGPRPPARRRCHRSRSPRPRPPASASNRARRSLATAHTAPRRPSPRPSRRRAR